LNVASGQDLIQRLGTIINSGAFVANVQPDVLQSQGFGIVPTDVNPFSDYSNRRFGV
jgi:hypothetical protein